MVEMVDIGLGGREEEGNKCMLQVGKALDQNCCCVAYSLRDGSLLRAKSLKACTLSFLSDLQPYMFSKF